MLFVGGFVLSVVCCWLNLCCWVKSQCFPDAGSTLPDKRNCTQLKNASAARKIGSMHLSYCSSRTSASQIGRSTKCLERFGTHTQCYGNNIYYYIYLCCGGNWMQNHCFIHAGLLFCRKEKIPNIFFKI